MNNSLACLCESQDGTEFDNFLALRAVRKTGETSPSYYIGLQV